MHPFPYTILSSAISLDGFIDDSSPNRLILSHQDDLDQVDALRASCDSILVGANTIRSDNPRLNIRSRDRIASRLNAGKPENLIKATLTSSGNISESANIFQASDNDIYIYCTSTAYSNLPEALRNKAIVLAEDCEKVNLRLLLQDLKNRGTERLLIEGGQHIATAFLSANLIDEFRLAIAPFFLGAIDAPKFVGPGLFPFNQHNRMHLQSVSTVGDMAVLTYILQNA